MKNKRILTFLLSGIMAISMSACGEKENNKKESSIKTTTTTKLTTENNNISDDVTNPEAINSIETANEKAEMVFEVANEFVKKIETAGKKLAADDNVSTSLLKIDISDETRGKALNISEPVEGTNAIAVGGESELAHEVNCLISEELDGTVYIIVFNKRFIQSVYWADSETSEIVGKYPSDDNYAFTTGGIKSIVENGSDAYGDMIIQ